MEPTAFCIFPENKILFCFRNVVYAFQHKEVKCLKNTSTVTGQLNWVLLNIFTIIIYLFIFYFSWTDWTVSVETILPNTHSFVSACSCRNPHHTGSNQHLLRLLQASGNQPVQAGRTQAAAEAPEEREEESDGAEPVGRRRQTAGQHYPGLRHPGPQAAEQVSTGDETV